MVILQTFLDLNLGLGTILKKNQTECRPPSLLKVRGLIRVWMTIRCRVTIRCHSLQGSLFQFLGKFELILWALLNANMKI